MADLKSYEDLINEIFELREDLGKKKKFATVAKAVEELAKKHGVDFVAVEGTTYDDYVVVLDVIIDKIVEDLDRQIDELSQQLDQHKEWVESQAGSIASLKSENEALAVELAEKNKQLKEINQKYDELLSVKWDLMVKAKEEKKVFGYVARQARAWKMKYRETVGWLDMILEKFEQVLDENKELKKTIAEEREKAGDEIAQAKKDIDLLQKDVKRFAEEKKVIASHTEIYAKTVKIIVDAFRKHGYDVLPLSPAATKKDEKRNRAWELYDAVEKAKKVDTKAQKRDKKAEQVRYPEAGLVSIKKEIAAEFDKMIKELSAVAPELVIKFYEEMGINPKKVPPTDQIIDKIIYAESQKKPFLKTTGGKILVIALVTVMIAGVLIPIFAGLDDEAEQEQPDPPTPVPDVEIDTDNVDQAVLDNFLQDANIALPGVNPTNVSSIRITKGIVEIVYDGYNGFAEPIQEVITFEAPSSWAQLGESGLTAEFILNNIPRGAEKTRFEKAPTLEPDDIEDSANDTFDAEFDDDMDMDDDTDFDDDIDADDDIDDEIETEDSEIEDDIIDSSSADAAVPPTLDSSAPMVSWKIDERNGRFKVTGTMLVDGDEVEFTATGSSVEQCQDDILETFWQNGYDVDYEMIP